MGWKEAINTYPSSIVYEIHAPAPPLIFDGSLPMTTSGPKISPRFKHRVLKSEKMVMLLLNWG
jgi:hypothetical protein